MVSSRRGGLCEQARLCHKKVMDFTQAFATPLPIDSVLSELIAAIRTHNRAVLIAPPGAGKTTRVPLALLQAGVKGKILMLEPRRIAARASARRMAQSLGEEVGQTVGYRVRNDVRVSKATCIEILTEGLFLRLIQSDPELSGVACVLFDEFHERSLDADLGLGLALEARALRSDLSLVAMSATLDAAPVSRLLDDAPVVQSHGRAFPVETRWLDRPEPARLVDAIASAIRRAMAEEQGSLLAFLPGQGEIRRLAALLQSDPPGGAIIAPLYGELSATDQDAAIRAAPPGLRKIVLATTIAETSLTIEGVRIVVDCGYARAPRFDPSTGMTGLERQRISQAQAEQRRGRAGRIEPGVCYRLWPEAEHRGLAVFSRPEILDADLAPFMLEVAAWGSRVKDLRLLDIPPAANLRRAEILLRDLDAVDNEGRITAHGRRMAGLGLHPRIAHMLITGAALGYGALACEAAAILSDRDILRGARAADLRLRLDALRGGQEGRADRGALMEARKTTTAMRRLMQIKDEGLDSDAALGLLVALAYPDRIAKRRGPRGQFLLASGRGAQMEESDALAAEDFLAVADLDGAQANARIHRAAPLMRVEIETHFAPHIETQRRLEWDPRLEAVAAYEERRLGAIRLDETPLKDHTPDEARTAMIAGIRQMGLAALPWDEAATNLRLRIAFLRRVLPDGNWPNWSDAALLDGLDDWLGPALEGMTRRSHLARLDLLMILHESLDWKARQTLDRLAPTHISVPSGSSIAIDYSGEEPVLAVRLQELFGLREGPRIADGRVPLLLHLLSPARRPVQVTRDLASFWTNTYAAVKKDLKGQYPKHHWPDDPLAAQPTARAKPRGQ